MAVGEGEHEAVVVTCRGRIDEAPAPAFGLLLPGGATTSRVLGGGTNSFQDFFRVKAVRPLTR